MKTKLISFALIIMLTGSLAIAQDNESQKMSFAILGGVNFQNLNGKDHSGNKLTNNILTGYHGGINIQIPIAPDFYFQPGVLYSTKGARSIIGSLTYTYNLSYFEVPLNLVYRTRLGNGKIMIGFGPYVGYGIGGKITTVGGDVTLETKVVFQNVVELSDPVLTTYYKSLDAGGNIFAGYEMASGLFLQVNTQFGILKINPENKWFSNDKASLNNTGFGLSLGFRF